MTDDALNRLVCEKVLGWELEFDREDGAWWKCDIPTATPDFLNDWNAFGVLWEALHAQGFEFHVSRYEDGSIETFIIGPEGSWGGHDATNPKLAFVLAALKAYGVEV